MPSGVGKQAQLPGASAPQSVMRSQASDATCLGLVGVQPRLQVPGLGLSRLLVAPRERDELLCSHGAAGRHGARQGQLGLAHRRAQVWGAQMGGRRVIVTPIGSCTACSMQALAAVANSLLRRPLPTHRQHIISLR